MELTKLQKDKLIEIVKTIILSLLLTSVISCQETKKNNTVVSEKDSTEVLKGINNQFKREQFTGNYSGKDEEGFDHVLEIGIEEDVFIIGYKAGGSMSFWYKENSIEHLENGFILSTIDLDENGAYNFTFELNNDGKYDVIIRSQELDNESYYIILTKD